MTSATSLLRAALYVAIGAVIGDRVLRVTRKTLTRHALSTTADVRAREQPVCAGTREQPQCAASHVRRGHVRRGSHEMVL
eukprot:4721795-Prymnesium_polylepis.1